jgi:carnosine N-methyltransferase
MTAGEFVEIYQDDIGQWDVIVTAFFLDTAKNVLQYMETFSRMLKKGGLWINMGPLLYHYSDSMGEISIELSYNEIRTLLPHFQFELIHEETGKRCHYTYNSKSMLDMCYNSVFFVCRKQ